MDVTQQLAEGMAEEVLPQQEVQFGPHQLTWAVTPPTPTMNYGWAPLPPPPDLAGAGERTATSSDLSWEGVEYRLLTDAERARQQQQYGALRRPLRRQGMAAATAAIPRPDTFGMAQNLGAALDAINPRLSGEQSSGPRDFSATLDLMRAAEQPPPPAPAGSDRRLRPRRGAVPKK